MAAPPRVSRAPSSSPSIGPSAHRISALDIEMPNQWRSPAPGRIEGATPSGGDRCFRSGRWVRAGLDLRRRPALPANLESRPDTTPAAPPVPIRRQQRRPRPSVAQAASQAASQTSASNSCRALLTHAIAVPVILLRIIIIIIIIFKAQIGRRSVSHIRPPFCPSAPHVIGRARRNVGSRSRTSTASPLTELPSARTSPLPSSKQRLYNTGPD